MKTTFLNPVLWLLAATAVMAAAGVVRGQTAKVALERTVRLACLWPVLTALVLMSAAGLASRAAIGARAERDMNGGQAAAVRRLLIQTPADAVETRSAFRDWIWPSERPTVPWETTAGSAPCPVKTMATQVPLFTIQADTAHAARRRGADRARRRVARADGGAARARPGRGRHPWRHSPEGDGASMGIARGMAAAGGSLRVATRACRRPPD